MTKIEEMLAELCPNGVEWKELGEVCNVVTDFTAAGSFASNAKNVKYLQEPDFAQLIRTTDLKSKFQGNKFIYVDEHAFNYLHRVNLNEESLILPNVGNCGEIYYLQPSDLPSDNNVLGPNALLVRSNMADNRYLYHLFLDSKFQSDLEKITSKTGQTKFNKTNLKKILIPIPPLEIQEEIVQILDKFTDYVTELTAELTLRQKQYSFYRDKLLSFEDDVYQVEWKTLGEIADFNYGYTDKAQDFGEVRFIRITDIDENGYLKMTDKKFVSLTNESQKYMVNYGDLLMARTGATYGKTLFIDTDEPSVYASFLIKIIPKESLNARYYWHFSKSDLYWNQANNLVSKAGQPQFNANSLKKVKIPVPPLDIQSRIVQVLDNFDTVCNDLNIGLPKEIELRQKQYEYFRDKLLTFTAEGVYTDSTVQTRPN